MTAGGHVQHVLNRGNARRAILEGDADDAAVERVWAEGLGRIQFRSATPGTGIKESASVAAQGCGW